jgi:DNA-binding response OmpR family regulator
MDDVLLVHREQEMQLLALLGRAGFYVQSACSDGEVIRAMNRHRYAVVIIGDAPSRKDGHVLTGLLRTEFNVAIITLGSGDMFARAQAVEDGSDIYLNKSVGDAELIARIHALIRRYYSQPEWGAVVRNAGGTGRSQVAAGGVPESKGTGR